MLKPQQTVERAIDLETDRRYEASELLAMSGQEFADLRRAAMVNRLERKKGNASPKLVCAICKKPLYLSRYIRDQGNRWFSHDGAAPDCPWYEKNKLSADIRRALLYRGAQEGAEHIRIKHFLATWLECEPGVSDVNQEMVTLGQILKGEWKRPDVQCLLNGKRVVFEIQLSYTFLSDVIRRDEFYKREGIFIIWVFNNVDLRRAVVQDEIFHNHRNLFALDSHATKATESSNRLTFHGHFHRPSVIDGQIKDVQDSRLITLSDVTFPTPSYRPYFFDYEFEKRALEQAKIEVKQKSEKEKNAFECTKQEQQATAFQRGIQNYISVATAYCESDYAADLKQPVLNAISTLRQNSLWHSDYEALADPRFYDWHGILAVLLSLKHNRPIGYKLNTTYQVLEAGLRQAKQRLAVAYLWAYKIHKPTVTDKQRKWVGKLATTIKKSIDAGEETYLRLTQYDRAISLLFPELEEKLQSDYAKAATD